MGAWEFVRPLLEQLIDGRWPLRYVGRVRNSSPSEGSAAWHAVNQRAMVAQAFEEAADVKVLDRVLRSRSKRGSGLGSRVSGVGGARGGG